MAEVKADDNLTALAPESGKWAFDESVTAAFDDMLARSIPNYGEMRRIVTDAASWFVDSAAAKVKRPGVVDIGASRGAAIAPLVDRFGARARFLACDVSEPMLEACSERFDGMIDAGVVEVRHHDLREGMPVAAFPAAAVLSVLTLQFVPLEHRQRIVRDAYETLMPGGAFIVVEKVLGGTSLIDRAMVDLYYQEKRGQGYTQEAIERKRLSLEGVLVPLTARWNEDMFRQAGFPEVDTVWSWLNFRAWLAVKP